MMRNLVRAVWFLAAALLLYGASLDAPFIFDDTSIEHNRDIRDWVAPWDVVGASPISAAAGRPIVHYSLTLNYALGGLDPRGYRLLNLAVHLACALVLFGVVRRTLLRCDGDGACNRAAEELAAVATMIWLVHPLHTECIGYISQRSETIMGLFYLLTLYAAIRALDGRHPRAWTAVAIVACALGMASKEAMVTAPLVVVLYDLVFSGRRPGRLLRERAPLYGGLAACWLVLAGLMATGPRATSVGLSLGTTPIEYAKNQCVVVVEYLQRIFWPDPLVLDYGYPRQLAANEWIPQALLLAVLLGATVVLLLRKPRIGFPLAWTFLVLAPTSSFVPIVTEVGAERRMYLALAGPVVLAVVGAWLLIRRLRAGSLRRWVAVALAIAVLVPLGWRTFARMQDYASAVAIWQTAVDARPGNHRAHGNLAKALQLAGRPTDAEAHYLQAIELRPDYAEALSNYGALLVKLGRHDEAIRYLQRALESRPGYADAHYNLAKIHERRRELEQAVFHYREALRAAPDHVQALNNLGTTLGQLGRFAEAIEQFRKVLRIDPGSEMARHNLEVARQRLAAQQKGP